MCSYGTLQKKEKVLEIGWIIGRNMLILSYLIGAENIIVIDACFEYIETGKQNLQNAFFLNSTVLPVAISNMPLKRMHWKTSEHEPFKPLEQDYEYVNTVKWNEFNSIYGPFDILVADCEGEQKQNVDVFLLKKVLFAFLICHYIKIQI